MKAAAEPSFNERRAQYSMLLSRLGVALENGDEPSFNALLQQLAQDSENGAMQDLRRITDELQAALERFRLDSRLDDLAQREVPDARQRLAHVMRLTDDAAHTTLDLVEQSCPIADRTATGAAELLGTWNGPQRPSRHEVREYLEATREGLGEVRQKLSQVLLAQCYQDLTGQIIRGVMKLVDELEIALTHMVRISGGQAPDTSGAQRQPDDGRGFGPVVPGVSHGVTVGGQTDVDALLSDLGM